MKRIVNINGQTKEEVLISKLQEENRDLKRQITELNQPLQLQQTGVSGCFSKEEVVNIILEFTNIALHSNSHNLSRTELRELLRVAKNGWLNNR